jgi:nickel-dependent lactate racemase
MRENTISKEMEFRLELPYGKRKVSFDLPGGWKAEVFRPTTVPLSKDPRREIIQSLENPLGGKRLEDFRGAKSAAIAVSDETRLIPYHLILPPLLERLERIAIPRSTIKILIASGLHPLMPESRFPNILPMEMLKPYSVVAHDANRPDLKFLGNTSRGTPVFVNPLFHQADLRLIIGLVDSHQFVGYTGGVKGAAIGLAGAQTIEANHSMLFHPQAVIGEIHDNPVRQDIEEIGKLMGVHFVVNVVLNETNEVVRVFSGDPSEVEKIGSEFCRTIYETKVAREYDLVIASPGGYPKDINVYQAQKALAHVTPLVRQGGDILFMAECPDGHGDEAFYQMMLKYKSPQEVINNFAKVRFKMGDHKAFLWCRSLTKAQVHLFSMLDEGMVQNLMTLPVKNIQEGLERINAKYTYPPKVAVMPKAASTYVRVQGK